ncbi:hypothetical protein QZH41_017444, partial [Actinostola sp. cb2023]
SHDRCLLLMAQCCTVQPKVLDTVMNILEKLNNRGNNMIVYHRQVRLPAVYLSRTSITTFKELRWFFYRKKQAQSDRLPLLREALGRGGTNRCAAPGDPASSLSNDGLEQK